MRSKQDTLAQVGSGQQNSIPRLTYKLREASEALGLSSNSVRRLILSGKLGAIRSLRHILVPLEEIRQWIDKHNPSKGENK